MHFATLYTAIVQYATAVQNATCKRHGVAKCTESRGDRAICTALQNARCKKHGVAKCNVTCGDRAYYIGIAKYNVHHATALHDARCNIESMHFGV